MALDTRGGEGAAKLTCRSQAPLGVEDWVLLLSCSTAKQFASFISVSQPKWKEKFNSTEKEAIPLIQPMLKKTDLLPTH